MRHYSNFRLSGREAAGRVSGRLLWAALIVAVLVTALSAATLRGSGRAVSITILHTNDLHGAVMPLEDAGGLARAATLVRNIRKESPNVILLDGGDIIHGSAEDYYSRGQAIIAAMNTMGYQAAATGNHEYDFGLPVLKAVTASANFPFLAANVRQAADGGQWDGVRPSIILERGGVKIGILGLTTLETISLHWPGEIRGIRVDDPVATAKRLVPELRKKVDVLVVLSHLGVDEDVALVKAVPGIDVIVGGHSHTALKQHKFEGQTLIAQTGADGQALGRIDILVRKTPSGARVSFPEQPISTLKRLLGRTDALLPLGADVPQDEALRQAYQPYRNRTEALLAKVIGTSPSGVPGGKGETPAADLAADAVRAYAKSQVAVVDAGSVTARGLPAGNVCQGDAFRMIGGFTRQHIVVARVPVDGLEKGLNAGFARKRAVNMAISGARVACKLADGVPQVSQMLIGGQKPQPGEVCTVAAQAYVMMDLMKVVPNVQVISEPPVTTREAIAGYIRTHSPISAPETGRISVEQ